MSKFEFDQADLFEDPVAASGATFSDDRVHRYKLWRVWDDSKPIVLWVLLNPSTADETVDDPTLRRAIAFSKREGFGGLIFTNLFAFRATDPKDMKAAADPIGPGNDEVILCEAIAAGTVICAWGSHGSFRGRASQVVRMLTDQLLAPRKPRLLCLGKTRSGQPKHPLYLSKKTPLEVYP